MRKLFWCCLAAGVAVCCAFGAAAYVLQNPDSPLARYALGGANVGPAAHSDQGGEADDAIPPDPVPVEEDPSEAPAPPAPPAPEEHPQPAVAVNIPPIVIHEDDDLNTQAGPSPSPRPVAPPSAVDVEYVRPSTIPLQGSATAAGFAAVEANHFAGAPMMPRCTEDASGAPVMPRCDDDDAAPGLPETGDQGKSDPNIDAFATWLGFLSGPSRLCPDAAVGRCEEDSHYGQQYPGLPYTANPGAAETPARSGAKTPPPFPTADEAPAPKKDRPADPFDWFGRPIRQPKAQPRESESDTMEIRPTDLKPHSPQPPPF